MRYFNVTILFLAFVCSLGSCKEEHVKMPWEDDLAKKHAEQNGSGKIPDAVVGQVLPRWTEGCFDIHLINSGRGEAIFYIMPDGTTMLIDAGETKTDKTTSVPQRPNDVTRPYMVNATYIKHFLPAGKRSIDYFLASHFHIDHIGSPTMASETSENGYKLAGITALFNEIPFNHLLDRAYPSYTSDGTIPPIDGGFIEDYMAFVKWGVGNKKFDGARFEVGKQQIRMLNEPEKYDNFWILNICGNGNVWIPDETGKGGEVINYSTAGGNPSSCGVHIHYGKFDYLACGDLVSAPQNAVSNYVKAAVPLNGLDAFKAHHHLSANSWGSAMQKNGFNPRVILNQNFSNYQPDYGLVNSLNTGVFETATYKWDNDLFTTNLCQSQQTAYPDIASKIKGCNGHIVLRVAPDTESFYVYLLDDSDMIYRIKNIYGPYAAK